MAAQSVSILVAQSIIALSIYTVDQEIFTVGLILRIWPWGEHQIKPTVKYKGMLYVANLDRKSAKKLQNVESLKSAKIKLSKY